MKIAEYNEMMAYLTRPEPLPQPKPEELLDLQEQKRKDRLRKTMDELDPVLMDESVDFIERENFAEKGLAKLKIDPTASKDAQILVQEGIYFKPRTGNFVVQLARGPGIKTTVGVNGETMKTLGAAKKRLAAFEEQFPKTIAKTKKPPEGSKKFLKDWMAERDVSKWEDLTKTQKDNFVRTVWPKVQKQSKLIANKIPASEMAELLGIDKSVLDNARKTGSIFAQEIEKVLGEPVNLVGKAGGTIGERGEYVYYDKPTSAQIKSLKTYIPKTFGQLTQDVTNRVKTLADDTEFMNDLKKIKTVDDVDKLKMLETYTDKYPELNLSSGKLARATLLISQVAGGNAEYRGLDNIKLDKVLSRRLNNMIENAPFGNVYKKEAYDLAMSNIDQQFGSETATFSKYRDKIKSEFNRLGFDDFKKFNLDEYVGTSIGGFKGAGQYSVFSRLLAADVNKKSGASYLGRLSQATDNLEDALALSDGKITKEIRDIVKNNMEDALRTAKKTKNSMPYLSLKPPGSKENFGVKRLNQLEAQGLEFKKFYKERGFGFTGLKEAMTQKEIISDLQKIPTNTEGEQLQNLIKKMGIKSTDTKQIILDKIKKAPISNKAKALILPIVVGATAITGADLITSSVEAAEGEGGAEEAKSVLPSFSEAAALTTGAAIGSKATATDPLKGLRRFGKQGAKNLLKGIFKVAGAPTVAAGFAGSEILDYKKPEDSILDIDRLDPRNYELQEDPNIKLAGASLLAPELVGSFAPTGKGILSRIGRFAANPFGKAARAFTPVGLATIGAGAAYDLYKEFERRQALTDEERLLEDIEAQAIDDEMMVGAAEGGRIGFADGSKNRKRKALYKVPRLSKILSGLDYLIDLLNKKTITVKRGESGTKGASSSFSDPDYKGKYFTPEGGGFGTAAEDARYYSKLGGDEANPKVFTAELTPDEIEEGLRLRALDSQDPEIGDIILPDSAKDKVKIDYLNTIRAQLEKYLKMAEGGRIGFASGPDDPKRRNFLKLMGGLASLPVLGKFFKVGEKAAPIVQQLKNTSTTMPEWFPDFVNKITFGGFGKKIDADIIKYEPKELPGIEIYRHDDGKVFVSGKNEYGKSYEIEYEPPGYELIDETTGKAVKRKGEFIAQEEVPVNVDPDGNADFDVEILDDLDNIMGGDTRRMEEFATGKVTKTVKDMTGDTGIKRGEYNVGAAEARFEQAADEAAERLADEAEEAAAALNEID